MTRHAILGLLTLATATSLAAAPNPLGVSFRLDPRVIDPTHGGTGWVAPLTYTGLDAQDTVQVRANVVDGSGRLATIDARWIVSDPEMIQVSPRTGPEVKIHVKRPGQSRVTVAAGGHSRTLEITARYHGKWMQMVVTQLGGPAFTAPPTPQPVVAQSKPDSSPSLPGGLRYEVVRMGSGATPTEGDVVECAYRVRAPNGQVLESSDSRGGPVTVSIAETRWKDALTLMPVGSVWRITVPGHQLPASGPSGRRHHRPRFSPPVTVEIELLSIWNGPVIAGPTAREPEVRL